MNIIYGDITQVVQEQGGSIVHQGNLKKVAGAGVALAIRNAWPRWYTHFRHKNARLGEIDVFPLQMVPPITIITIYAQENVGTHQPQTDPRAFATAVSEIKEHYNMRIIPAPIYMPYRIGCGLGGGNWSEILPIIQEHLPHVVFVDFSKGTA